MKISSVLIIDDEMDFCLLLESFFKRKCAHVNYALTLKDGLVKFNELNPDLLILDHNLPDGFGIESISTFKNANSALFVIFISAMSNLKSIALENGADLFMEKPISFSKLSKLIT